jgi:iron complex outermembrane receptor protein
MWKGRILCCCAVFILVSLSAPGAGAKERTYRFDIPASDARTGLSLLAQQSNTPLFYLNEYVRDIQTNRVKGTYSVHKALDILLKDTGIRGAINESGVLTINLVEPEDTTGEQMTSNKSFFSRLAAFLFAGASALHGAPGAAQGTSTLEEVIVTAQKREQSLQEVGIAVTALSEDRLVDAQVNTVEDLQGLVPGLKLGESFGFAQIMVRGVGTDNPFAGGDPSVAMHVDGVVTGQSSAQLGSLFDVQRVEVLRGPQGTLYGRNTTGGSVNVITNKPTEELSGYGRFTAGDYSLLQFEGAVGGPLSQQLRGRIATKIVERDGYGDNLFNGGEIDDASTQSVRGHLQWLPNDAFDVLVTAEYHREDDNNYMPKFRDASYPTTTDPRLMPTPSGTPRASDPRDIYADALIQNEREQWSITATLNWALNDRWTLTSISNHQEFEKIPQQDFDFTGVNFYVQSEQIESTQSSQEFQLHYQDDRINGLFGFYYYYEEIHADNRLVQDLVSIGVPAACGTPTNSVFVLDPTELCFHFLGTVNAEAAAAFANFSFAFTDNVNIILGGRFSYEKRKGFTDRWTVPFGPVLTFADEGDFFDFTPRLGVEWNATDDILLYWTYAEGFKSGILLPGMTAPLIEPETVDSVEVGLKGRFLANRLQINAAAFFYNYADLQVGRSVPAGATGFTLVYENAAAAEIEGVELEASWLLTDRFRVDGSMTYLDASFKDFVTTDPFDVVLGLPAFGGPPAVPQQLAGNRLVQAPEWTWTIRGEYDFAIPFQDWGGTLGLEALYTDEVFFTPFNHAALGEEDVTTVNANLKLTSADDTWSLNLWGKNLTDEDIYKGTFIINGSRANAGMLAAPRTFGVTLGYNF